MKLTCYHTKQYAESKDNEEEIEPVQRMVEVHFPRDLAKIVCAYAKRRLKAVHMRRMILDPIVKYTNYTTNFYVLDDVRNYRYYMQFDDEKWTMVYLDREGSRVKVELDKDRNYFLDTAVFREQINLQEIEVTGTDDRTIDYAD